MIKFLKSCLSVVVLLLLPVQVFADIDGKSPLICAINDVDDCAPGKGCTIGDNESLELPDFLRIDFTRHEISARDVNENGRKTVIQNIQQSDEGFLLQGSGLGRGWTLSLNKENGEFALAATGNGLTFVAFGVCTKE